MNNYNDNQPLLVSVPGVQWRLGGIGVTKVYDLIKRGELVKVNIGRRGFITAKSLEAYVDRITEVAEASTSPRPKR